MTDNTAERLATVGELLIRAAATLAAIPSEQHQLLGAEGCALDRGLYDALIALSSLSSSTDRGLRQHGRDAFTALFQRLFL